MFFCFEYLFFFSIAFLLTWSVFFSFFFRYRRLLSTISLWTFALFVLIALGITYSTLVSVSITSPTPLYFSISAVLGEFSFVLYYWPFLFIYLLITLLTVVYCFAYNYRELQLFQTYVYFILLVGGFLFWVNSLLLFFLAYEAFLIPSFLVLYNFAKTRKATEASFLMFFWTQLGAIFLIFNFQYLFFISGVTSLNELSAVNFSSVESKFLFWTALVGFGVKFPIWPFYDWLPKAHVEASTNFSIFLSGVLVKFAFFGFLRYLLVLGFDLTSYLVYPLLLIGFFDASLKVYYQLDLKKLIAYSTVIEMHWLVFAALNGSGFFWVAGFAMMISHALVSANFFLLIDSVTRRFKTRLISELGGLFYVTPTLYLLVLLMLIVFLGFPGSLLFVAEFLFFSALLDFSLGLFFLIFFVAYFFVPVCFFRSWFLLLFGSPPTNFVAKKQAAPYTDLSLFEIVITLTLVTLLFWFGLTFQFFL